MTDNEPKAPHPGWIMIGRETAQLLRAAMVDRVVTELVEGKLWAPAWAEAICSVQVPPRLKMLALKKAARDPSTASIVTTLVGCIDPADRKELVEQLGQEFAQRIICPCGAGFESSADYLNHAEFACPKSGKAINKI